MFVIWHFLFTFCFISLLQDIRTNNYVLTLSRISLVTKLNSASSGPHGYGSWGLGKSKVPLPDVLNVNWVFRLLESDILEIEGGRKRF